MNIIENNGAAVLIDAACKNGDFGNFQRNLMEGIDKIFSLSLDLYVIYMHVTALL